MNNNAHRQAYSITQLNQAVRESLESSFGLIRVEAEISNIARPASGHWYFSLKDASSQIRGVCFRNRNRLLRIKPEDGQQILVRGRVSLYEPRGEFQLIVEHMELAGEGQLQHAFEQLKRKLLKAGMFEARHKKKIPTMADTLGIITSPAGAAIQDILNVVSRRYPGMEIIIYPTAVQGTQASKQIHQAILTANRRAECDILILARGGGSLEDLQAFNDEKLAAIIFESDIPVVTGIGHEIDDTIADFVADLRAPSPSAAAELCTPNREDILSDLQKYQYQLMNRAGRQQQNLKQQLDRLEQRLHSLHPGKQINQQHVRLQALQQRLQRQIRYTTDHLHATVRESATRLRLQSPRQHIHLQQNRVQDIYNRSYQHLQQQVRFLQQRLRATTNNLNAVSPLATLSRGYSITQIPHTQEVINNATRIKPGDRIRTRLYQGYIFSTVDKIQPKN